MRSTGSPWWYVRATRTSRDEGRKREIYVVGAAGLEPATLSV